tara:strand:- start:28246 stop:29418 length:1173 start_codon:yes stop_codon:yes gene_type:complete
MSRFHSYLNSAVQILSEYDGNTPFSLFIKRFFSKHKKYGSRDRRLIADYCYQYFRIGKAFQKLPVEERILTGIFLCSSGPTRMMEIHNPEWNQITNKSLEEKIIQIEITEQQLLNTLFPWEQELSDGIEFERFAKSYFAKPSVFIRVRSQKRETVRLKLKGHHIPFKEISEHTFSVEANSKLDQLLKLDSEVVIQDLSSQKIREFLPEVLGNKELKVWDCCAASGGKSILAFDINPMIKLTVSDIRTSILKNLEERFLSAGINNFQSYEIDLTQEQTQIPNAPFDVIIADVPCSGSGTWGRTPEQLFYFEESKIEEYANLQRSIISNAVLHLNNGGFLVYITCSVFKKENEANIEFLVTEFGLNEIRTEVLKGYNQKADSMFVSVLKKDF